MQDKFVESCRIAVNSLLTDQLMIQRPQPDRQWGEGKIIMRQLCKAQQAINCLILVSSIAVACSSFMSVAA